MTDFDINRALALAIGWLPGDIIEYEGQDYIGLPVLIAGRRAIKLFSYRFCNVIWPIAERYNCFPSNYWRGLNGWGAVARIGSRLNESAACDTAAKAVAMAMIGKGAT